eukprot:jgi/Botrbrau1/8669/Bobra.0087s0022.1
MGLVGSKCSTSPVHKTYAVSQKVVYKPSPKEEVLKCLEFESFGNRSGAEYYCVESYAGYRVLRHRTLKYCPLQILVALRDDNLEKLGFCWNSWADAVNACTLTWAVLLMRDAIIAWIMNRPGFVTPSICSSMRSFGSFDRYLLTERRKQWISKAILTAVLRCRVYWDDLEELTKLLLEFGGKDFAMFALNRGYALCFSIRWKEPALVTQVLDSDFIERVQRRRRRCRRLGWHIMVSTAGLELFRAVHTKDLAHLRDYVLTCPQWLRGVPEGVRHPEEGLLAALREGWVPGVQFMFEALGVPRDLSVADAALADPGLACLDLLLENGLGDLLFVRAFEKGQFEVVETLIQKGCLEPAGKHMPCLPWRRCEVAGKSDYRKLPPNLWASSRRDVVWDRDGGLGRRERPSAQRLAYVVAQINPSVAKELAPKVQKWREQMRASAVLLLQWWALQSQACAERHGCTGSCHLPHVLEAILVQAGFMTPSIERRAQAIAAKMRTWMQV